MWELRSVYKMIEIEVKLKGEDHAERIRMAGEISDFIKEQGYDLAYETSGRGESHLLLHTKGTKLL